MMKIVKSAWNWQILNNSVKRKAVENLCERPRNVIHKIQSQDLDTVTYKDTQNISRNIHTALSSKLLSFPTETEETHEALNAVQMSTSSEKKKNFFGC
jgi:hypothetical protein